MGDENHSAVTSASVLLVIQGLLGSLVDEYWAQDVQAAGERIKLYREYMDGKHRLDLTENMAKLLRIEKSEDERFSLNYSRLVVTKKSDRLRVERIDAIPPVGERNETAIARANEWVSEVLAETRFDALQGNVHRNAVGDGTTFVVVNPTPLNDGEIYAGMVHEPAYDGYSGMVAVYDEDDRNRLLAAAKIWWSNRLGGYRFNINYADRIERYFYNGSLQFVDNADGIFEAMPADGMWPVAWLDDDGRAIGVLAVAFDNQDETWRKGGRSEMADAMPSNDVLNRSFMSMSMASEYTGFQIKFAKGFPAPAQTGPGTIIEVYSETDEGVEIGISRDREVSLEAIEAGSVGSLIDACNFAIDQIGSVTETPLPAKSDTQSGEALKQRESGLASKVGAAQPGMGNAWEDVLAMMHRVQSVFGMVKPPSIQRFNAVWEDAQVRNDAQIIANAQSVRDSVPKREYLKLMSPVTGWNEQQIDAMIEEMERESVRSLMSVSANLPLLG